jgi:hypothetical protein
MPAAKERAQELLSQVTRRAPLCTSTGGRGCAEGSRSEGTVRMPRVEAVGLLTRQAPFSQSSFGLASLLLVAAAPARCTGCTG